MQLEDIKKLALLARIDMSDEELEHIAKDFNSILAYVDQVKEASSLDQTTVYPLLNIMRDDVVTNKTGKCNEKILAQMPETQDGFLKVKQIL